MDISVEALQPVAEPIVLLVLFLALFALGRWAGDLVTSYRTGRQLTDEDNPALAVGLAGYYLGIAIIFVGAALGPSQGLQTDAVVVFGYTLGGIVLLLVSRWVNDRLILRGFSAQREVIEDQNPGTGAVLFGSYVASALVVAGAVHGEGGGPLTALAFWALGQVALVAFTWLYDLLTPYSLLDEIEQDNVAAGVGLGGALVAIGLIVMRLLFRQGRASAGGPQRRGRPRPQRRRRPAGVRRVGRLRVGALFRVVGRFSVVGFQFARGATITPKRCNTQTPRIRHVKSFASPHQPGRAPLRGGLLPDLLRDGLGGQRRPRGATAGERRHARTHRGRGGRDRPGGPRRAAHPAGARTQLQAVELRHQRASRG
ncbi:MAG: hypothetical protein BRD57_03025 [Proteobacteria bacterium SW_6_67_9]|nr:MAG: hypothetical protein BRD57_03025 [Proteobacteria bacterium SW_6_67_9]